MSKRSHKKQQVVKSAPPAKAASAEFGFEEMLSELEAIVVAAQASHLAEEHTA